jgi:hypothetical protein
MILTMTDTLADRVKRGAPTRMPARPLIAPIPSCTGLPQGELRTWRLPAGQTLMLTGWKGRAWVTMEGDQGDYVLEPGRSLDFVGPGLLVLQALEPGVVYDWNHGA